MDIGLYIAELLHQKEKVSVPGVGTFYKKRIASFFDEELQVFFPANEKYQFKVFEDDDTSFIEYISKTKQIALAEVSDVVKKFATKFNTDLSVTGTASIRGLGELKKDGSDYFIDLNSAYGLQPISEASLILQPSSIYNPLDDEIIEPDEPFNDHEPESPASIEQELVVNKEVATETKAGREEPLRESEPEYAIEEQFFVPIEEPIIKVDLEIPIAGGRENYKHSIEELVVPAVERKSFYDQENPNKVLENDLFSNLADTQKEFSDDAEEENEPTRFSGLKVLMFIIPIFLVFLAVLLYFFHPKISEAIQKFRSPSQPTTAAIPAQPLRIVIDSLADSTKIQPLDTTAMTKTTGADSTLNGSISYEIIVASFSLKREAETHIKQSEAKGQKVRLIEKALQTFRYKVSAGSFPDQESAQKELPAVQKNINKEAWIYQVTN